MEIKNLKYCINAKNEHEQLLFPCNCYREAIFIKFNLKDYKVTYCKHWKDYLIKKILDNNRKKYTDHNIYPEFVRHIFYCLDFYPINYLGFLPREKPTVDNFINDNLPFYEPVFFHRGLILYHPISSRNLIKLLMDLGDINIEYYGISDFLGYSVFRDIKDFPYHKFYELDAEFDRQCQNYLHRLKIINGKSLGKRHVSFIQQLIHLLTIKSKFYETNKC